MTIYLDITDVVVFLKHHQTLSGIQRVQMELFRHFHDSGESNVRFVIGQDNSTLALVDTALLRDLLEAIDTGGATRSSIDAIYPKLRGGKAPAQISRGDIFFVSGAFWVTPDVINCVISAKAMGAKTGILCYDLIPILQPDYTSRELTNSFRFFLDSALNVCDFAFTISHYVKKDLDAYTKSKGIEFPVVALPLAHQMASPQRATSENSSILNGISKDFVLFVSTLEFRKNHAYTLEVWRKLLEVMPEKTPDLVWVGRKSWLADGLLKRVENLDNLSGKLKVLSDISDSDLTALYENCLFTVYPSFAEGWGLPVAESLLFGKPVVSSNTTSMPEAGGDFPWYIDPHNVTEGFDLIRNLLEQPELIRAAESRIASDFVPRTWKNVGDDLMEGMKKIATQKPARKTTFLNLENPRVFHIGADLGPASTLAPPEKTALSQSFVSGWYDVEHWGRWLAGTHGRLDIHRTAEQAGRYLLALEFQLFDKWKGRSVSVRDNKGALVASARPVKGRRLRLLGEVNFAEGANLLSIEVDKTSPSGTVDPRSFSIGLISIGLTVARSADNIQILKAQFAEDASSQPPSPILQTVIRQLNRIRAPRG